MVTKIWTQKLNDYTITFPHFHTDARAFLKNSYHIIEMNVVIQFH